MIGFGLVAMLAEPVEEHGTREQEYSSGIWPAGVSIGLWLAGGYFLGLGMLGSIFVQVGLFCVFWAWNVLRDKTSK